MGIYVDQQKPDCRILVSGSTPNPLVAFTIYAFARFNPLGKEEAPATGNGMWCYNDLKYGSARGSVVFSGAAYYYYDDVGKYSMGSSAAISPW
jgi:hypothetical protein